MVPLHSLEFCFRFVMMEPAVIACHNTRQKIISFIFKILILVLQWNLWPSVNEHWIQQEQGFRKTKFLFICCTALCATTSFAAISFSNELIMSFLIAFHGDVRRRPLRASSRVPICEMYYPSLNSAGAHAEISIGMLKSEVNLIQWQDVVKTKHRCHPLVTLLRSCSRFLLHCLNWNCNISLLMTVSMIPVCETPLRSTRHRQLARN